VHQGLLKIKEEIEIKKGEKKTRRKRKEYSESLRVPWGLNRGDGTEWRAARRRGQQSANQGRGESVVLGERPTVEDLTRSNQLSRDL
jgi:hypothetical protein